MPKILVIIVTFNGKNHIKKCLEETFCFRENIDFIVIDNASEDDTVRFVKNYYPQIKIIVNDRNLGFGAANNIGLRYAISHGYDYVYLLNQDAWISSKSLIELLRIAESNSEYGIISPLQVYPEGKKIDNNFSSKITKELTDHLLLDIENKKEIYTVRRKTLQAAHWLVRVEALKIVGGFSPSYFHWGEDTNLCQRMEYHGFLLGLAPWVKGFHNRENRKEPSGKSKALIYVSFLNAVSDPNSNIRLAINTLMMKMLNCFMNKPCLFISLLFRFTRSLPSIIKNRKKSINKIGAFLAE